MKETFLQRKIATVPWTWNREDINFEHTKRNLPGMEKKISVPCCSIIDRFRCSEVNVNKTNRRSSREIQVSNYESGTAVLLRVLRLIMLVDWSRIRHSASLKLYFGFITKHWFCLLHQVSHISEHLADTVEIWLQVWVVGNQMYSFCYRGCRHARGVVPTSVFPSSRMTWI